MNESKTFLGAFENPCVDCGKSTKGKEVLFVTIKEGTKELWHKSCRDKYNADVDTTTAGKRLAVGGGSHNTQFQPVSEEEAFVRPKVNEPLLDEDNAKTYADILLVIARDSIVKNCPEVIEEKQGYGELLSALVKAIHGEGTTGRLIKAKQNENIKNR